jgi:hypothetical protein
LLLRDRVYAPYGVVCVLDGLTAATIDGLPDAIGLFVRSEAGRLLRRRYPALRVPDRRVATLVRAAVRRMPDDLSPRSLVMLACERTRTPNPLPVVIVTSGSTVAIRVPHAAMDGRGALEFVRFVIDSAAGEQGSLDLRARPRLPYLRMLAKHLRPAAVQAYRLEQRAMVPGPIADRPTADDLALRSARFETFVLSADETERLSALGRRSTSSGTRLGSLALGTLRRVYLGTEDMPVQIPVDLRRWAPSGRVDGNFISVAPLGSLLETEWTAAELTARLRAAVKARTPVVRSLHGILWQTSRAPQRGLDRLLGRAPRTGRLGISLSMLVDPTDYVDEAWIPEAPRRVGAATVGPWPSSTFVSVVQSAHRVRMTVWDETGLFDLDRFREAMHEELDALAVPA